MYLCSVFFGGRGRGSGGGVCVFLFIYFFPLFFLLERVDPFEGRWWVPRPTDPSPCTRLCGKVRGYVSSLPT